MSDLDDITFPTLPSGQVELVADGRHLRRVIHDGILKARFSVDITTADLKAVLVPDPGIAASKSRGRRARPPSIVEHLARIAQRGVEVRVLHAGVPSGPALQELKKLSKRHGCNSGGGSGGGSGGLSNITLRRCPRLHAKSVVIDMDRMYLGSANLTGAGLGAKGEHNRNFELGVWTTSPDLIDAVSQYFNHLWEGGGCTNCGRKDICPVPLEEPRL